MRTIRRVLFAAVVFCLGLFSGHAQIATGIARFGSYAGSPDVINLGNLNAYWDIPVTNRAGRGTSFTFDLSYNSYIYSPLTVNGVLTWVPVANWGWQGLSPSGTALYATYNVSVSSGNCGQYNQYSWESWTYSGLTYVDQTGVIHPFPGGGSYISSPSGSNQCPPNGPQPAQPQTVAASDGSGYKATWQPNEGYLSMSVATPSGSTIYPVVVTNPPAQQTPYQSNDNNGNQISNNGNGAFTDTLGTTALSITGSAPSNTTLAFTNPGGTQSSYVVSYKSYQIRTSFQCTSPTVQEYSASSADLVDKITLPDGRYYQFAYESTGGDFPGYVTGRLASVTLPTGGTISYVYTGSNGGIECLDGSPTGMNRTTPDGTWKYSRALVGSNWTTTITDPANNQTVISFYNAFYELTRTVYSGSSVAETVTTCWAQGCSGSPGSAPTYRQVAVQMGGSNPRAYGYAQTYDSNGNLTEQDDYDWGSAGSGTYGSLLRKTVSTYASLTGTNAPTDLPASVIVEDASNHVASTTYYRYDESGRITATSNTPQHATGTNSGNLTSLVQCITSSCSSSDTGSSTNSLVSSFSYYDTGNVNTVTDVNGAVTTYIYSSSGSCGNSFLTSVGYPLSLTTSTAWNCNGGAQTSSTDFNGNQTTYSYTDPNYWAVRQSTDPWGNVTNYTYPGAGASGNTSEVAMNFNGGASTSDVLTEYDELGRALLAEQRQGPGGFTFNVTQNVYDSLGRPTSSTLPYALVEGKTPDPGYPGTTTSYDVLNRVSQVSDAEGGSTAQTWNQNYDTVTIGPAPAGENTKQRQLGYDGLGRLISVCEITSLSGAAACGTGQPTGYLTQYTYDGASRLTGVTQNAQGSGSHQTRSVSYDWLGRKTQETIPETGTTQYTYDSDSTCGSYPGDLVKIEDNMGNITCMAYDSLHRMTSAKVQSGGQYYGGTQQTYYVYDVTSNPPAQLHNAAGNLVEAYTCQSSGCSSEKLTDIFFSTSNAGGGMLTSQMWETTSNSGGYYYMTQDTYYPNGTVQAISASYTGSQNPITGMPSMTYGVNGIGQLTNAIDNAHSNQKVASSACYTSDGQVAGIVLGNGDGDAFGYDWKTLRPTSFQYSIGTGSNAFNIAGSLSWNANASLAGMNLTDSKDPTKNQNCTYSADDLQRLVTVSCGGQWGQTFSYDAFGNINKTGGTTGGPGITFAAGYNSSTNQVNNLGFVYDLNGNVRQNSLSMNFVWNAAGQPVTVQGVSATYDALGRMVETNNGGTYTQYIYRPSGDKLGAFRAGALISAALPLPGGMGAVYNASGLSYIRHMDYLGSSRLATTWAHTVYAKESYAPFGEPYNEAGTQDRVFTGQTQDTTSGVYDYLFRKYDPTAGRWLSPDPAGWGVVDTSDPQSFNRYAYVENDPMSLVDIAGLGCTQYNDIVSAEWNGWSVTVTDYGPNMVCTTDAPPLNAMISYIPDGIPNFTIRPTIRSQQCDAELNSTPGAKLIQFFSLYHLATDFKHSWMDWTIVPGAKIVAANAAKAVSNSIGGTQVVSVTGGASTILPGQAAEVIDAGEAAGSSALIPGIAFATAVDLGAHQGCNRPGTTPFAGPIIF